MNGKAGLVVFRVVRSQPINPNSKSGYKLYEIRSALDIFGFIAKNGQTDCVLPEQI